MQAEYIYDIVESCKHTKANPGQHVWFIYACTHFFKTFKSNHQINKIDRLRLAARTCHYSNCASHMHFQMAAFKDRRRGRIFSILHTLLTIQYRLASSTWMLERSPLRNAIQAQIDLFLHPLLQGYILLKRVYEFSCFLLRPGCPGFNLFFFFFQTAFYSFFTA